LRSEISGGASEILGKPKLKINVPSDLYESIIDFTVRVHELEHIIQILSYGMGSATTYFFPYFAGERFHAEKGAMRAEGTFLLLFPKRLIRQEIQKIANLNGKPSQRAVRYLTLAKISANTDEYLEYNWSYGRYSMASLVNYQLLNLAIFPGGLLPFFTLAHIFGW
jgi:hypothetical protein